MELNSKSEIGKNKKWKYQKGKSGCGSYMQPLGDVLQGQSNWGSAKLDSKSYSKETANEKWKWEIEVLSYMPHTRMHCNGGRRQCAIEPHKGESRK